MLMGLSGAVLFGVVALMRIAPDRPVAVVFWPGTEQVTLARILAMDPDSRLIQFLWGERVVVLNYRRSDFPRLARQLGALMLLDAAAVGCSASQ